MDEYTPKLYVACAGLEQPPSVRRVSFSPEGALDRYANLPSLVYRCSCSTGFTEDSKGFCKPFWGVGRVAGAIVGVLLCATALFLYLGVPWYRRRRRNFQETIELKEHLLQESTDELVLLKKAWEIAAQEISLDCRIDDAVEG